MVLLWLRVAVYPEVQAALPAVLGQVVARASLQPEVLLAVQLVERQRDLPGLVVREEEGPLMAREDPVVAYFSSVRPDAFASAGS